MTDVIPGPLHEMTLELEGARIDRDAALRALDGAWGEPRPGPGADSPLAGLASLLLGSRDDRFGPTPGTADVREVQGHVEHWVHRGAPVPILVMWGGLKHYVRDEDQGVDLAELFALRHLRRLSDAARATYPPGLRIMVCLEDFGVWYEDARGYGRGVQAAVELAIARYLGEFESLLLALCGASVQPLRFRDLVEPGTPLDACERQADRNLALLHEYWAESDGRSGAEAAALPSHRALVDVGWAGHIPPEMRAHYLGRLGALYPRASHAERVDRILRYFAIVLLYQQLRVFARTGGPWLKASMYKPAPGIPEGRVVGRLHLRTLPRSVTTKVIPPWTAKGCLAMDASGTLRPALESFRLAAARGTRFVCGRLTIRGAGRSVEIRSDVALPATVAGGRPLALRV